jgi:hypothetical protein
VIMSRSVHEIPRHKSRTPLKTRALKGVCAVLAGIFLAAMLAACGLGGFGMGLGGGEGNKQARKAEQMADDMVNQLDQKTPLTYTKIAKVRAILIEHYKKRPNLMARKDGPPPPKREDQGGRGEKDVKGKAGQVDLLELELSLVLNKNEMAAYKELARGQKEEMKKPRSGGGEGGG